MPGVRAIVSSRPLLLPAFGRAAAVPTAPPIQTGAREPAGPGGLGAGVLLGQTRDKEHVQNGH